MRTPSRGRRIANIWLFFPTSEGDGQSNFYVANVEAGGARKLTNLKGYLADPAWSPDEKTLAFLFTENAPRAAGPLMPMVPETGVIDQKVYEQRLTLVDLASGKVRQLSPPDMYVYQYDWSPDGKTFAAIAAHGSGDSNWYLAEIYTLSAESGELKPVYKPSLQIAVPRWSPDGKTIAFIGGLMSDEGSIGGDVFTVPATGGRCSQRHAWNCGIAVVAVLGIAGQNSFYGKCRRSGGSFRG